MDLTGPVIHMQLTIDGREEPMSKASAKSAKEERLEKGYPRGWELRSLLWEAAGHDTTKLISWETAREIADDGANDEYKTAWVRLDRMEKAGLIKIKRSRNTGRPMFVKLIPLSKLAVDERGRIVIGGRQR